MNHLWIVTFKSAAAKRKLLTVKELQIKNKRCIVFDPNKVETRLKIHWVSFHLPEALIREALEPYGKVEQVTRETWRAEGFEGVESTTRVVRLILKENVTLDQLPHQLRLPGGNALVVVPGRAPLCLRCKMSGHIRKDCRVPRRDQCRRFGHKAEDCSRTFATVAMGGVDDVAAEVAMYEAEAECTSKSSGVDTESGKKTDEDVVILLVQQRIITICESHGLQHFFGGEDLLRASGPALCQNPRSEIPQNFCNVYLEFDL